ncbi:COQ9 family protein [Rhodobacteraceae bacterium R_SAG10]|jgi:ubiquinone biosynthesis protein COQ9|nr:COQ9 family protein [Rhodobacteraceae bacterium R_SAG10]
MTGDIRKKLLDAALAHVPFDGWGAAALAAAARDIGISVQDARALYPRGAAQMAAAYHVRGDDAMVARMEAGDHSARRYSEKVAALVRYRLEAAQDKELVRRAMTLFALPQNAADGARLIWGTADRIWCALGDTSDDINWYSKRAILSGVYGSCVLFWLGDTSDGHSATWTFVDRRIADVMRFEKFKSRVRDSSVLSPLIKVFDAALSGIKAPSRTPRTDLPGRWSAPKAHNS